MWQWLNVSIAAKPISVQAWAGPEGSRRLMIPEFADSRHMNVVRLSALRSSRLYYPGNIHISGWVDPRANDTIANRTRNLPACSTVPQATAPPRAPKCSRYASLITLVEKKLFSLPVKIQSYSYSFDVAESEYDSQIPPSPTDFKVGGTIFKKQVFNKKVICWFLITIYNVK
jgi:hypothetical protein